jgi:hypothetical protein
METNELYQPFSKIEKDSIVVEIIKPSLGELEMFENKQKTVFSHIVKENTMYWIVDNFSIAQ